MNSSTSSSSACADASTTSLWGEPLLKPEPGPRRRARAVLAYAVETTIGTAGPLPIPIVKAVDLTDVPPVAPNSPPALTLNLLTEFFESDHRSPDRRLPTERALDLMRAMPGAQIKIPPMKVVERMAEDNLILRSLRRDPSEAGVTRVSNMVGRSKRQTAKVFAKANDRGLAAERKRREQSCPRAWRHSRGRIWVAV